MEHDKELDCYSRPGFPMRQKKKRSIAKHEPHNEAEIRRLLEAASDDADIPIAVAVRLMMEARIRRDELFTVKWSHVDNTSHTVSIPRSGEVDSIAREVAISEQLTGLLEKLKSRNPDSEYIFDGLNAT